MTTGFDGPNIRDPYPIQRPLSIPQDPPAHEPGMRQIPVRAADAWAKRLEYDRPTDYAPIIRLLRGIPEPQPVCGIVVEILQGDDVLQCPCTRVPGHGGPHSVRIGP
jgi:hypothetical protein